MLKLEFVHEKEAHRYSWDFDLQKRSPIHGQMTKPNVH